MKSFGGRMCQSCGLPLQDDQQKGTKKDGSKSDKYCTHCYQKGEFTWPDATVEQMQTYRMGILTKKALARFLARMPSKGVPKLERWRKSS